MKTSIKRFSKRTISIVLAVMMLVTTLTIGVVSTNAAYTDAESVGVSTYFTKGETIFIYKGSSSAYDNNMTVKAWFNKDGSGGSAPTTKALKGSYYYVIVPSDNLNRVQIQKFDSNNTWKGSNGDVYQSNRGNDAYNVIQTTNSGESGASWKNETFKFKLNGEYVDWNGDNAYEFADSGNAIFTCTITNFTATKTSYEFKVKDSAGEWYGNNNTTLDGFTVNDVYTINASFDISTQALTLTKEKTGSAETLYDVAVKSNDESMGTVSPASVQAGETTNPQITATPKEGYDFTGWTTTGGASVANETSATTTVSATAAGTVTANFAAKQTYAITVASADNGSVAADKASAYSGQTVTLTVSPADGYKLESLAVKAANGDDVTATASSDKTTYTFTMPASAVTVTPTFAEKTTKTLYLKNSANWSKVFVYLWTGDTNNIWPGVEITSNKKPINGVEYYYYELPDDINYTNVIFDVGQGATQTGTLTISGHTDTYYYDNNKTDETGWIAFPYDLTITAGENGTVTYDGSTTIEAGSSQTVNINKDTSKTIVATPNTGYKFTGWTVTGDATVADETSASTTVTATANGATVTANFEIVDYTLTKGDTTGGSFTLSTETANYNDEITVTCTPNKGYKATKVTYVAGTESNEANLVDNTATFTMPASDVTVNVTFTPEDYAITTSVTPANSGTISVKKQGSPDGESITQYNIGDTLVVKADPATGNTLEKVVVTFGDGTPQEFKDQSFTLDTTGKTGTLNIEATFNVATFTGLSANAKYSTDGTNYDNDLSNELVAIADEGSYAGGVSVTAQTLSGYQFVRWYAQPTDGKFDDESKSATTFHPLKDNAVVTAQYKRLYTVSTTTSGTGLGTVTASETSAVAGTDVTITVDVTNGLFTKLLVDGTEVSTSNNTYTLTLNGTNDSDNDGIINVEAVLKSDYYIRGTKELTGTSESWVAEDCNNAKANDDGTYTITFESVPANQELKFKPSKGTDNKGYVTYLTTDTLNDSGCTVTLDTTDNSNFKFTLTETSDVTITFNPTTDPKTMSVTAVTSDPNEYEITLNDADSEYKQADATVSTTASRAGRTVTVTTSPKDGYVATVVVTDAEGNQIEVNNGTFTMPRSNVTVAVTYGEKPKHTVTVYAGVNGTSYFIYNGTEYAIAGGTFKTFSVTEGDKIALRAEVANSDDYTFEKWVRLIESSGETKEYTDSSGEVTNQTINGNVTYTSSFKEVTGEELSGIYLIYAKGNGNQNNASNWGNSGDNKNTLPVYLKGGRVVAYLPDGLVKKDQVIYFALSSTTNVNGMYYRDMTLTVTTEAEYKNYISVASNESNMSTNYKYKFGYLKINSSGVTAIKFDLGGYVDGGVTENKYQVIPTLGEVATSGVEIKAKDGTIRDSYQKFANMADTKFVSGHVAGSVEHHSYYDAASALVGNTVTIKTTIDSAYRSKYYVRGFVVNGQTYCVNTSPNSSGVYTLTLPITEDMAVKTLEVTPVYFYSDTTDVITFYVRGFSDEVAAKWGNTIAAHFWYNGGHEDVDATADDKNAHGGYPGQPLLNEGGYYYIQVPKYLNGNTSKTVTGVTLNNYVWDNIHGGLVSGGTGNNCQTYDFKDFVRLSELSDTNTVDNIIFDFKYRTTTENRNHSSVPTSTEGNSYTNGWEYLTDYYGRNVDIYGNIVTDDSLTPVYVVSKGYQSNKDGKVPSATYGAYATSWTVYIDGQKKLVENCAALINASSQDDSLVGHPTYITYESSIYDGSDKGYRCDGRWYYSRLGDKITANVKLQYSETKNGTYIDDPFKADSNVGTTTGTLAYFTDDDFYGKTEASGLVDSSKYFNINAETDPYGEYTFLGWYQEDSDGKMVLFSTDPTAKVPMAGNGTYVARFYKTPAGSVSINHKHYSISPDVDSESTPALMGGKGDCLAKVEILDENGVVIKTYDETAGTITIPETYIRADSTYTLKITLTSKPAGINTFWNTYYDNAGKYETVSATQGSSSAVTTVRTRAINELFDENGDLLYKYVNYYSDFAPVAKPYKITFNYKDRFGASQIYVVKGSLPESYITENGATLTDEFVMGKAPYEDNFGETIKWNDASISYGEADGTLTATVNSIQTGRTVYLTYRTSPDEADEIRELNYGDLAVEKNDDGTYFKYDSGKYKYLAEAVESITEGDEEIKFSYWGIFTDAEHTDLVAKCYSRKFNYVLYADYYIVPVYDKASKPMTESGNKATIQLLEYSRNQWTDDEGVKSSQTDRLYADFQLAFNKDGQLLNEADDVTCGILFEVGTKLDENLADAFKDNPERFKFETDTEKLKQSILNGDKRSDEKRNLLKTEIATSKLSNKNRIEFYKGFANSSYNSATDKYTYTNALYVIKVYSYMIDANGDVTLSDPVYINFYDVATMQYTVS